MHQCPHLFIYLHTTILNIFSPGVLIYTQYKELAPLGGYTATRGSYSLLHCFKAFLPKVGPGKVWQGGNVYVLFFIFHRMLVKCRNYINILECTIMKEDGSFHFNSAIRLDSPLGSHFGQSLGPNNKDFWISGGVIIPSR